MSVALSCLELQAVERGGHDPVDGPMPWCAGF